MGVQGLWELLAPVGRRVSVETLAGKKLAIDASIWMIQFMKAIRDERGEMVRNAHILGFFRRICKLLFLRTKPVFVFDGGTPALKRRTVIARRRHRDNARAKIRKTAEKLLLNHLRAQKLEEMANDIKDKQQKGDSKGKSVVLDDINLAENISERMETVGGTYNQQTVDELLAASLAAAEDEKFTGIALTSVGGVHSEGEDDGDGNEEMIFPEIHGKIDPMVLAALPPSMQLDLLVQMRERLMAENRQKYQKVKKAPTKFSELQIQAYLKTVAFRREIDEVQKSAAGRGVGGVQTSRIASEANREFIFSSSFIGDKQLLTSAGVEKIGAMERRTLREEPLSSGAMNCISSAPWVHSVTEAGATEPRTDFDHDVGTYLDERGRVRVSRVSGLGMRMTRDLQRNLDLMKELEQEKNKEEINSNSEAISNNEVPTVQKSIPENNYTVETSTGDEGNDDAISSIGKNDRALGNGKNCHSHEQSIDSVLGGKTSMEISFLEDSNEHKDTNDLFVGLVTGNTIMKFSSENISSKEHSHVFSSVSTWEKEMLEEKSRDFSHKNKEGSEPLIVESDATDEGEVDWEEGVCEVPRNDSSCQTEHEKEVSRFSLEEEPDIQEAIRRSLEDCTTKKPDTVSSENANLDISGEIIGQENTKEISRGMIGQENTIASPLQVLALEKDRFDSSTYMSLEEGVCDVPRNDSPCQTEQEKAVSRFSLEEEADIQEAIKRSLEDCTSKKPDSASSENANLEISGEIIGQENTKEIFRGMIGQEITIASPLQVLALGKDRFDSSTYMSLENSLQKSQISSETGNGLESLHNAGARDVQQNNNTPWLQSDGKELVTDEPCVRYQALSHEFPSQEGSEKRSDCVGLSHTNQITTPVTMRFHRSGHGESFNTSNLDEMVGSFTGSTNSSKVSSDNPFAARGDVPDVIPVDVHKRDSQASHPCCSPETTNDSANFLERETDVDREQEPIAGKNYNFFPDNGNKSIDKRPLQDNLEVHIKASEASLDEEILLLRQERIDLGDEQRKLERNAESVSSEMFAECQELLQMFGLPYIIAPMEAEAQCAYMELTNQVDGVVTDDSDAFLFGARSVYKNIFDDRKYVETYFMKDIESELGLTRERLIHMALLLGSDYTEGVSGIGIVNAIEVVRAFPEEDGLQQFREWIESPDPAILGKIDAHAGKISRKRWSKANKNETDALQTNVEGSAFDNSVLKGNNDKQTMDNIPNIKQTFMDKHRNVGKNWHIPSSFPSESVISAYSSPQVDKSTEPFSWGKPDLHLLRQLCWERFVWSNQKADELLVPVLKEYDKHETQLRLEAFYTFNERFAKIRSQRIKKAVKGITGNRSSELMDGLAQEASKSRKKRRVSPSESGENKSKKLSDMTNDSVDKNDSGASEKTDPKHPRKRNKSQEVETFQSKRKHRKQNAEKGSSVRGRGRGRGKNGSTIKSTEISSSDGEDDNQKEAQGEKTMELPELRRSARPRPHITYAAKDLDVDSLSESSNQSDGNCSDEMAVEQESLYNKCTVGDAPSLNEENQDDDPSPQDYLMSGGGFCTDDSNQNGDPIQLSTSPARTSDKLSNGGWIDASEAARNLVFEPLSGNMDGLDVINEPPPENLPKLSTDEHRKIPCEHVKEINAGTEPVVVGEGANLGLSAMPYLRRKKRTK